MGTTIRHITGEQQLMLEMINRGRMDPLAEAARFGIDLNQGLEPGTIQAEPMQALAWNDELWDAAIAHSDWMLEADVFSHTGEGGSAPTDRIRKAGYELDGSWSTGENLAYYGTSGDLDLEVAMRAHYDGLFLSPGHRVNTLNAGFREIGISQETGIFTREGNGLHASMVTENFGLSGAGTFLTGVAYDDADEDRFYGVGEGARGTRIEVGGMSAVTAMAGGYTVDLGDASGPTLVRAIHDGRTMRALVDLGEGNVKLDLVDGARFEGSADLQLGRGSADARLLGAADLDLKGNGRANELWGNEGDNRIHGGGNDDRIWGGSGRDHLTGGAGHDALFGGAGRDVMIGNAGVDLLHGGGGFDIAVYAGRADMNVDLAAGRAWGQGADRLRSIEAVKTGGGDDHLVGTAGRNRLAAGGGDDLLEGGGGNDRLIGGSGNDRLVGEAGNDRLHGGQGRDVLAGGAGDDYLIGGTGVDSFVFDLRDGEAQRDRVADLQAIDELIFILDDPASYASAKDFVREHSVATQDAVLLDMDGHQILLAGVDELAVIGAVRLTEGDDHLA